MTRFEAVELTAHQAWVLADYLQAGTFPWKLAITAPYFNPEEREAFNEKTLIELTDNGVIDSSGNVKASVAHSIRSVCHPHQWLEWMTLVDADQVLRGVLVRPTDTAAVVALRYAQMVTFTPMELTHSEAVVPIITAGLPIDAQPARFTEFELSMKTGAAIDTRIARGADIVETLTELGIPEQAASVMELARTGDRVNIELTAHVATGNGAHHHTDVSVNIISTEVGLILVSPASGESEADGISTFAPGDTFAIAMAVRELTARLPTGPWFPEETYEL